MSKLESKTIDKIGIYRSQGANDKDMIENLKIMTKKENTAIIGGDMKKLWIMLLKAWINLTSSKVSQATHMMGWLSTKFNIVLLHNPNNSILDRPSNRIFIIQINSIWSVAAHLQLFLSWHIFYLDFEFFK